MMNLVPGTVLVLELLYNKKVARVIFFHIA